MDDLGIVEASHDLEDGIDGANVGEEGVAETGAGRGTARQTGNVVDGQVGGDNRLWLVVVDEPVEAVIGDDDTGLFRVDRGIGKILQLSTPSSKQGQAAGDLRRDFPGSTW